MILRALPRKAAFLIFTAVFFLAAQLPAAPVRAEEGKHKKASGSEEGHSKTSKKSKKKKDKKKESGVEDLEEEEPIGADAKPAAKQFEQEAAQAGKVDAILVLDSSRSMQRTDPHRLRDQAAKLFLRFLGAGDRVAVISFDREAKVVVPLTGVVPAAIEELDKSIEQIPMEGGFTDLEAALEEAIKLLEHDGRKDATQTVVLLSDGKMDPHPSRGTPAELTEKVKSDFLPAYEDRHIKLYTVAFSEESDRTLLSEFAQGAGGLSWYAPDASTIHKKFSELFLTLKRPQVVPLEGEGFEIDPSVTEATFYISRKEGDAVVTLVDPHGTQINSEHIPAGIKWFRGELFDVVTLSRPMAGRWTITGLESAEGFATLLSDIQLQVRWPQSNFKLGDSVVAFARLINGKDELVKSGIEEITFYTYKILNAENGETISNGALNDKGEEGDAKAGDGIYSTTLKMERDGEYQAFFAVTSPTFTRQQRVSFTVAASSIKLVVVPPDDFAGTAESLQVVLSKDPSTLKSLKVQLVAKPEGSEKLLGVTLTPHEKASDTFDVPLEKLPPGDYELSARYTAVDEHKKKVGGASESIKYTIHAHATGTSETENIDDVPEVPDGEEHPASTFNWVELIVGIGGILLACGWIAGLGIFGIKKASGKKSQVEERTPYSVPEDLAQRMNVIRTGVTEARRRATDLDREIFQIIPDVFGKDESGDQGAPETDTEPPAEEEQAPS